MAHFSQIASIFTYTDLQQQIPRGFIFGYFDESGIA